VINAPGMPLLVVKGTAFVTQQEQGKELGVSDNNALQNSEQQRTFVVDHER
jgi:hypothetical protein